jgi:hypothetical protein
METVLENTLAIYNPNKTDWKLAKPNEAQN